MKHCKNCGAESPDVAPSCIVCGYKFTVDEVPMSYNSTNYGVSDNTYQDYNQQGQYSQFTHNHLYYNPSKNKALAVILSCVIIGLGNAYLHLFKRFAVEIIITLILSTIFQYVVSTVGWITLVFYIFGIIYMVWVIYTIYDTYLCAKAIQNNEDLPLLFRLWDIR